MISDIAEKLMNMVYEQYGSGYDVLFGIPASLKRELDLVTKAVLMNIKNLSDTEIETIMEGR